MRLLAGLAATRVSPSGFRQGATPVRLFPQRRLHAWLLVVCILLGSGPSARAQVPPDNTALTPAEAQQALQVLQDGARRQEVINALRAIAAVGQGSEGSSGAASPTAPPDRPSAAPLAAAAPSAPLPSQPTKPPAPAQGAAPAEPPQDPVTLTEDSLLAEIMVAASAWLASVSKEVAIVGRALANIPLVWDWVLRIAKSPSTQSFVLDVTWKLVVVLLLAWAAKHLMAFALRRPMRTVGAWAEAARARRRRERETSGPGNEAVIASPGELRFLRRAPLALLRLVLDLLPIAAFAAVGNLLLTSPLNSGRAVSLVIVAAVNAYVVQHVIMAVGRTLVSPDRPLLRLINVTDETAAYIEVWLFRLSAVAIYGLTVLEIARILGLYSLAYQSAVKLVILANHLLMAVVVLQCRKTVARKIAAPPGSHRAFDIARNWIAAIWHILAIFLLFAVWFVWAVEIRNGYSLLFRYFGATVAVLVVARLVAIGILGMLDRVFRISPEQSSQLPFLEERANRYYPLLRRGISILLGVVSTLAVLQVWGVDAASWFSDGRLGQRIADSLLVILIAATVAIAVWELTNAWVDRQISEMVARGEYARSARLRTLLPLLRTALLTAILVVIGFTALSQLGVNIAPLLAGASIVGVALGFGSQKLVQDVITGMFLLLENTMQVGDWVTVSGLSGTVEELSVRTIRLRAGDGSVHVVPFSSVTTVTNTNRGVGNAAVSVTVAFDEDTDRVGEILKEIGAELRNDPDFRDNILEDFALWGVDKVDGAAATVLGQMKCVDTGRWGVQREFNRRIKKRFQELDIRIAVPAQAVFLSRPPQHAPQPASQPSAATNQGSGAEPQSPPTTALGNTQ